LVEFQDEPEDVAILCVAHGATIGGVNGVGRALQLGVKNKMAASTQELLHVF
jgi:hypothetical protein